LNDTIIIIRFEIFQVLFKNEKEERQAAYLLYEKRVRQLTEKVFKREWFENKNIRGADYVLDHKVSIRECFENDIPIEWAAHECNLQIVSKHYNLQKGSRSSITIQELIEEMIQRDSDLLDLK